MAQNVVVIGTQWGDEGKGAVVDVLAEKAQAVVRFQGGHNAGHTVVFDGETYILHLLPTGVLRPNLQCCIGNGVVIDPDSLIKEMDDVEAKGINFRDRLFISHNAHLILPYHQSLDLSSEEIGAIEVILSEGS